MRQTRELIYVAGPMRGYPEWNVPAFKAAKQRLTEAGFAVISPADISAGLGEGRPPCDYMRADIAAMLGCEAVALLPGWEHSVGARCEATVGVTLGLPFYDATTCARIDTPPLIRICGGYERPVELPGLTLDELAAECREWSNATFTVASPGSKAEHLRREAEELCRDPNDVEEMADIFILLAHASCGHDLVGAVRTKLDKNKRRSWGAPDSLGVVEHIGDVAGDNARQLAGA